MWEKLSRIKVTPDLNCETLVSDLVGLPWRAKFCRAGSAESEFILLLQAGHDAHSGAAISYKYLAGKRPGPLVTRMMS